MIGLDTEGGRDGGTGAGNHKVTKSPLLPFWKVRLGHSSSIAEQKWSHSPFLYSFRCLSLYLIFLLLFLFLLGTLMFLQKQPSCWNDSLTSSGDKARMKPHLKKTSQRKQVEIQHFFSQGNLFHLKGGGGSWWTHQTPFLLLHSHGLQGESGRQLASASAFNPGFDFHAF